MQFGTDRRRSGVNLRSPHFRPRLRSDARVADKHGPEARPALDAESRAYEGGDRVSGHRRHPAERHRAHTEGRTNQATPKRRQVRRIVGEAEVLAPSDREEHGAVALAREEAVPPLRVLPGLRHVGADPEEGPVQVRIRLGSEELAVEVDADLEARVAGHGLDGGRAADRVTDDPDVLQVEVSGERRARLELCQLIELVEREPDVGHPGGDQALERPMRRRSHYIGMDRLTDDRAVRQHRDR
jgi:hypothetical protein